MATEAKKNNRVQGMEVPGWVTEYHKWEAMPLTILVFFIPWFITVMITLVVATMKFPAFASDQSIYSAIVGISPSLFVGTVVVLVYIRYGRSKCKAARAYAEEELIAILGIKEEHYCKVTVELGLTHLAHAIQLAAGPRDCRSDLILGGFAKARTLARMAFDFPPPIVSNGESVEGQDCLSRTLLCGKCPFDTIQPSDALDNHWINLARSLKDSLEMQAAKDAAA